MKKNFLVPLILLCGCVPQAIELPSNPSPSAAVTGSPMPSSSAVSESTLPSINPTPSISATATPDSSSGNNSATSTPTPMVTVTPSVSANGRLVIPAGFLDNSLIYSDSASLRWPSLSGAKYFKIYKGSTLLADNLTGNEYLATGLTSNTDYTFAISAVNDAGESDKLNYTVRTKTSSSGGGGGGSGGGSGTTPVPTPTGSVNVTGGFY